MEQEIVRKKIHRRRIYIALVLGLFISSFLLFENLSEVRYVEVAPGSGDYLWIDTNHDGIIDLGSDDEFLSDKEGNYIRQSYQQALSEVRWDSTVLFWLLVAIALMFVRDIAYMIRIRVLTDNQLSWRQAFRVILTWEFASAVTPGVVGGAAVAMFILKKEKVPLGKATGVVMVTAMLDNLFYLLMIPLALLLVGPNEFFPTSGNTEVLGVDFNITGLFWLAYVVVFVVCLSLFISAVYRPKWIKGVLVGIFSIRWLRRKKQSAIEVGDDIIATGKFLRNKSSSYWLKAFGATCLSWTGRFLVINALIAGFVRTGLMDQMIIFARQLGMWVIMIVSPTPGGTGIAEFTFTEFLDAFIPFGLGGILAILWRLISYYPYLFIGITLLPRWVNRKED